MRSTQRMMHFVVDGLHWPMGEMRPMLRYTISLVHQLFIAVWMFAWSYWMAFLAEAGSPVPYRILCRAITACIAY